MAGNARYLPTKVQKSDVLKTSFPDSLGKNEAFLKVWYGMVDVKAFSKGILIFVSHIQPTLSDVREVGHAQTSRTPVDPHTKSSQV